MPKMIAAKGFTYATRRLVAEDPFMARTTGDARLLVALGRARYATADCKAGDEAPRKPKAASRLAKATTPRTPRKPKQT